MNSADVVAAGPVHSARLEAEQLLARSLAELEGQDALGVVSLPAPLAAAEALLDGPAEDALLWAPPGGPVFAGVGHAALLAGSGSDRFGIIREQASALRPIHLGASTAPGPMWFGGFAFQTGRPTPAWDSFGEARFTLPRWRYARGSERAWLDLAVHGRALAKAGARDLYLQQFDEIWRRLARSSQPVPARKLALVSLDPGQRGAYEKSVAAIVDGIHAGRFEKVVAARRAVLELDPHPDPRTLLARLSEQAPGCTRFAFRVGGRTFLGATPERLIDKRGLAIRTEALAGSIRAGDPHQASLLQRSQKDLGEHQLVVREIVGCLAPLCSQLEYPDTPEIRGLRHVLHLRTPIRGQLASARHVLELVDALHPTPAVGGVPSAEAQRWIAECEPEPRGWYAGPVGCFDADGDGQFAVALRSGLFEGPRAHLFAGAGIVRDSDPASEYAETGLKLESLLSALGVDA